MVMCPLQIEILLWYYCRGGSWDRPSQAFADYSRGFLHDGLLAIGIDRDFNLTDMGRFYVEYLLSQPLPVIKYVIPTTGVNNNG